MYIYYLTILFFYISSFIYGKFRSISMRNIFDFYICTLFLFIYAFRYNVGVDWYNYIQVYQRLNLNPMSIDTPELAYKFINVISSYLGFNIVGVIFICTTIFYVFTYFSCKRININPYYFFAVVAPYHLVMSGVNYTRQAVALSIVLFAFSYLMKNESIKFLKWLIVASLFHVSSLIFLPLYFLFYNKKYLFIVLLILCPSLIYFMLGEYNQYVEGGTESAGFLLRCIFLIFPSFCIFCMIRYINELNLSRLALFIISGIPFLILLSFVSSTIADRVAYYYILFSVFFVLFLIKELNITFKFRFIIYIGLSLSSIIAFSVWVHFSSYIPRYMFDNYFLYWL